jgi:Holliday junction resolvase-like predicted endonuclease
MSILADGWSLVNSAGEVISEALGLGDGDDSDGAMGSLRYILVEGDPLVGETGVILPVGRSSPALTGIPVAFIGDMVQCYTCGQIKPIEKDGGPYRVGIFSGDVDISVFDIVNATEEFAYENDVIYCACGKKPPQAVLAPVQQAKDIEDAPTAAMLSGLKRELGEGWELTKTEVGSWTYGGISSGIHIGLGAAGAIPVLGVVPDVVDAVYTSGEAIFSNHSSKADVGMAWGAVGASLIPGVDQAADAAKIAKRTADAADLVHDAGVAFDASKYALKEGEQLGKFGENVAQDHLRTRGYDEFFDVQNKSGNGVDIVARNSSTGDMMHQEVKTTQQDKLWNGGDTKPIPLSKEQKLSGAEYTDSRLNRAAKGDNGYTDGVSTQQAKEAQDAIRDAELNGAKIEYEKVDVHVDKDGLLRGDPVIRSW